MSCPCVVVAHFKLRFVCLGRWWRGVRSQVPGALPAVSLALACSRSCSDVLSSAVRQPLRWERDASEHAARRALGDPISGNPDATRG